PGRVRAGLRGGPARLHQSPREARQDPRGRRPRRRPARARAAHAGRGGRGRRRACRGGGEDGGPRRRRAGDEQRRLRWVHPQAPGAAEAAGPRVMRTVLLSAALVAAACAQPKPPPPPLTGPATDHPAVALGTLDFTLPQYPDKTPFKLSSERGKVV